MKDGKLTVLIVEDIEVAKKLVNTYFARGGAISYVSLFDAKRRDEIVNALDKIDP